MGSRNFAPHPICRIKSIRLQGMLIQARLPGFRTWYRNRRMFATGDVQPSELSKTYRIRLEYRFGFRPRVEVRWPALERRNGEAIPHMFDQKYLCLHLPGTASWSPDQEIARTIVPWTSLWLYYYELWHATGEWLGGGHEPGGDKDAMPREVLSR